MVDGVVMVWPFTIQSGDDPVEVLEHPALLPVSRQHALGHQQETAPLQHLQMPANAIHSGGINGV